MQTINESNKLVYAGQKGPFYEVYYFKTASLDGLWSFWCRYTLLIPKSGYGAREASVWGIFSAKGEKPVVIKKTFSLDQIDVWHADSHIRIEDNYLSVDRCVGCLQEDLSVMSWDLQFEDPTLSGRIYPHDFLYKGKFPKSKFVEPRLSTYISGHIKINHTKINLDHHLAHQAHIWGTQYANSWAWAHCNQFGKNDIIFEGLTARIPLGSWSSPQLSLFHFYFDGEYFPVNKMRSWLGQNSKYDLFGWHFELDSDDLRLVGTIRRQTESIVGVTYFGPDGDKRYCHNSSRAQIELSVYKKAASLEFLKKYESSACAFETVSQKPDERIRFWI